MWGCGEKRIWAHAVAAVCALNASPALALDEIYSPNVEYRELSVEYNGNRTFDPASDKNNAQEHEFVLEAGVTPNLMLETSAGLAKGPDDALRLEDIEVEGRYQFSDPGQYWLDSGLLLAYGFSTLSHESDSLEAKLLLQKDTGKITTIANIGFVQSVGQYSAHTGGPDLVLLANSRYRYNEYFQPGIELQSDFGQNHAHNRFDDQEHYIGPAVYGKLFGRFKYQAAYLFGASDAAAQSAARLLVEYEMHF